MIKRLAAFVAALMLANGAWAQFPDTAVPESVGLSSEGLAKLGAVLQAEIDSGALPGVSVMIQRRGRIAYFETFGVQNPDTGAAMPKDGIFRIYSMTKPIVSVGLMMLAEDGKLSITDAVAKWIPELGGLKVAVETAQGPTGATLVAAKRDITVQDLLRHTSGLTYGVFGKSWVKSKYLAAGIHHKDRSTAAMTKVLGTLPLMHQPGEVWEYSRSTDVLGRLIEVITGQSLGDYLEDRIYQPLGMTDTGFFVPPSELGRVVEPQIDPSTGKKPNYLDPATDPIYESGGGGLFSTTHDYSRFTRMMLNGGELDGVRLLGRKTVALMTANHLAPGIKTWHPGYGFGLGFSVRIEQGQAGWPGSVGEYWWAGYGGTLFWVDPAEELIVIYMSQKTHKRRYYRRMMRYLVSQAIID
ncbi:MAG: serine hydrolase [Alphaproteobacteria bacterium]